MKPERWQQAREVLADALELKPEDRSAFLDRACSSDHALREEVERLLSSSDEVRSGFLQTSALRVTLTPGTELGDYEVKGLVGSGGMGEVYRARDTRLGRDVAIKVLLGICHRILAVATSFANANRLNGFGRVQNEGLPPTSY